MSLKDISLTVITGRLWLPVWYFLRRKKDTDHKMERRQFRDKREMQRPREMDDQLAADRKRVQDALYDVLWHT